MSNETIDDVAVELIMGGLLRAGCGSPERKEAIRRLAARGLGDGEIAERIGMRSFNVYKLRERHGIPAGVAREGHPPLRRDPSANHVTENTQTLIEQAIARGEKASRIMAAFGIDYATYRAHLDRMEGPVVPPVPRDVMVGGRPLSSYYGPASHQVIEDLINALSPAYSRRRGAGGGGVAA